MRWICIILMSIAVSVYSQNSTLRIHEENPEASSPKDWASTTADIWVDAVEGNDNNGGRTSTTPIKTLSRLNEIIASSTEGIRIAISDAVYYGTISISGKTGTSDDYYEIVGVNKWGNG
ncbi:MAG: hypothetical protein JW702_05440, partial [Clostridiales bacterium]|nr:hypothetical protein [Clostridiales bacterium]